MQLEADLTSTQRATAEANNLANAFLKDVISLSLQMSRMLTRVTTSDNVFTDPGLAQSWTEEDEETMESEFSANVWSSRVCMVDKYIYNTGMSIYK